jgi:predicted DNA-binding WGR domain protein
MITVFAEELHYIDRAANSDKFYRVYQWEDRYVVQYGRAGTDGSFKTTVCPGDDAAAAAASKQADAKFKKGYERTKSATLTFPAAPSDAELDAALSAAAAHSTPTGESSGPAPIASVDRLDATATEVLPAALAALETELGPPSTPAESVAEPLRPMLAISADARAASELIADDDWSSQPKLDGERFLVEVVDGAIRVYNRQGRPKVSNLVPEVLQPFAGLSSGRWVFDGEVVERKLWVFDLLAAPGFVDLDTPFSSRHRALCAVAPVLTSVSDAVGVVECARGTEAKQALLDDAVAERREGVVFRRDTAGYQPGQRSAVLVKYKLVKSADCVVIDVGAKGKENAVVAVHGPSGLIEVGSVSTIGKETVSVGDVVEVHFLYVVDPEFPRMVQARLGSVRRDKDATECSIDQFADAVANKSVPG